MIPLWEFLDLVCPIKHLGGPQALSLRYVGGPREIEARKEQQHQFLRGGLKGRGPQEKILWQQITGRLARTIEEEIISRRRVRRLIHPGKKSKEE